MSVFGWLVDWYFVCLILFFLGFLEQLRQLHA